MAIVRPKKLLQILRKKKEENINLNTGVEQATEQKVQQQIKQEETKTTTPKTTTPNSPETFTDVETGKTSGVTLPDGRTFFGLTPQDINKILQAEENKKQLLAGTQPVGTTALQQQIQNNPLQAQTIPTVQETGFTTTDIPTISKEGIRIGGDENPYLNAISVQGLLNDKNIKSQLQGLSYEDFKNLQSDDPMINSIKPLIENEYDYDVLVSGGAKISAFGEIVESIPGVGSLARKYFGNFVRTPSSKVDKVYTEMEEAIQTAESYAEQSNQGNINKSVAIEKINQLNRDINLLQSKLKLISMQSPDLQTNPEEINQMNYEIIQKINRLNAATIKANGVTI